MRFKMSTIANFVELYKMHQKNNTCVSLVSDGVVYTTSGDRGLYNMTFTKKGYLLTM